MDDELESLRKKRMQELQQQQMLSGNLEDQEVQQQERESQRQMVLRAILTNDARERLGRIKIARPEIVENIENQLIMIAQSGRLKNKINDAQLQDLLTKLIPKKRDITIERR
ncbi:MAG: DNA-binding protein [Euryarchaeota archaeon]|nr:DNA-binding protein [Euryarchaeota archaeon]